MVENDTLDDFYNDCYYDATNNRLIYPLVDSYGYDNFDFENSDEYNKVTVKINEIRNEYGVLYTDSGNHITLTKYNEEQISAELYQIHKENISLQILSLVCIWMDYYSLKINLYTRL